jgi:hypothetical protein
MRNKSAAVASLCSWVRHVYSYHTNFTDGGQQDELEFSPQKVTKTVQKSSPKKRVSSSKKTKVASESIDYDNQSSLSVATAKL